jgi:flagellar protein FliS
MAYSLANSALQQYRQVKTGAGVESASPHRLIQMLFEGALERLASAKGHLQRGEIALKGEQIGKAIGIIGGLRESLNEEAGGEIARNLGALYDYMERRLFQANLTSDPALLDEVSGLLREVKAGWDGIGS